MPIRVVIADDHPLVLRGLESLLDSEPDFQVVAQCPDGEQALEAVRAHKPDILVLDLHMPRKNGLEVLRSSRPARCPPGPSCSSLSSMTRSCSRPRA